ncbi:MAG: 3-phosphoshikimate 1-carboxyvinyltransferase, partial [Gemmatimonadetes bacterium]|nr:3-phosphoshikimate 1-carboxyvinyltransferase [Gemmatimonadota bacterium]
MTGRCRIRGRLRPPGDKSLSHRALIFAALSDESAVLTDLNPGADVDSTAECLRRLGVTVARRSGEWRVSGVGTQGLRTPRRGLDCGNSGTSIRLLAGVLAGCGFRSRLTGDRSLSSRPMSRVTRPLRKMGARIQGQAKGGEDYAPLRIDGGDLRAVRWTQEVASAQVKSAVLLAALTGGVRAEVVEPLRSRDHTERMLRALGVPVKRDGDVIRLGARAARRDRLRAPQGSVPGDPSAAAYFAALAAALPGSDLTLEEVCLNPTRLGFFRVLERMGARVEKTRTRRWCGESVGTIRVRPGKLRGVRIGARAVPSLVDEI